MRTFIRLFTIVAFMFIPYPLAAVQGSADPSGHWQGEATAGDQSIPVVFDVVKGEDGKLTGTFSGGPEGVSHLPLATVSIDGRTLRLVVGGGEGEAVFTGTVADDGASVAGEVVYVGQAYPFTLKRTGPAELPVKRITS